MEYIGATGSPIEFDAVPIQPGIDFHFILGFAIDADSSGTPLNGEFKPYWADTLSPESISSLKAQHGPSVKVMASLSGWSLGGKVLRWTRPNNQSLWISNAASSLRSLIATYHLDGVDVDYENFGRGKGDIESFAFCIGELIAQLKRENSISVASIAPFHTTVAPYAALFRRYGGLVDYVNYQFYTDKVRNPVAYLAAFRLRAGQFGKEKLLPSYEVSGRGIQGDGFFDALTMLERNGFGVNGVMIFSADASAAEGVNFEYEKKAQAFLLNVNSTHLS
ncbi:unnamed protein product [Linum tenue]|uniref:GH18 domain-containing protein n=1 Tax=Linum tenue TaxID=586396 RepID=A0AAV0GUV0_9ROSI|nr:unnamed protein product [Linum tenue]